MKETLNPIKQKQILESRLFILDDVVRFDLNFMSAVEILSMQYAV